MIKALNPFSFDNILILPNGEWKWNCTTFKGFEFILEDIYNEQLNKEGYSGSLDCYCLHYNSFRKLY
jgi:hypothetical protein